MASTSLAERPSTRDVVEVLGAGAAKLGEPGAPPSAARELLEGVMLLRDSPPAPSSCEVSNRFNTATQQQLPTMSCDELQGLLKQVCDTGWDLGPEWSHALQAALLPHLKSMP
ncbi:hypothetical protein HaLaN_10724, partial [Haematococcus lacustris]